MKISSLTSVTLRAMMANAEVDPDEEYMTDIMTQGRWQEIEPCWYTLKASPREIVEHFIEGVEDPYIAAPEDLWNERAYKDHPRWCGPCEGYNVNGHWVDCEFGHQYTHRWEWNYTAKDMDMTWRAFDGVH